ncbi:hypothetical protein Purlil1_8360 [Purpureocillium lilacinum]|uniref:Uncharacterized protein n=1 Tax=Purpureocillium lilacinum TaxID=33203 RepID=A0ABR0BTH2_PURLI|nr:hypothetical protein Purlil1_8360 [Purpureocillium lilacinum]
MKPAGLRGTDADKLEKRAPPRPFVVDGESHWDTTGQEGHLPACNPQAGSATTMTAATGDLSRGANQGSMGGWFSEALGWFSTVPRQPGGEELAAAGFLLDAVGTDFVRGDGAARRCYNNGERPMLAEDVGCLARMRDPILASRDCNADDEEGQRRKRRGMMMTKYREVAREAARLNEHMEGAPQRMTAGPAVHLAPRLPASAVNIQPGLRLRLVLEDQAVSGPGQSITARPRAPRAQVQLLLVRSAAALARAQFARTTSHSLSLDIARVVSVLPGPLQRQRRLQGRSQPKTNGNIVRHLWTCIDHDRVGRAMAAGLLALLQIRALDDFRNG